MNSKYIQSKWNWKLEVTFFGPFWVSDPIDKQAYKLELPKKWRIHNVFHIFLLEQDTTKKEQVEKLLKLDNCKKSKEYEVEVIQDSAVYGEKLELGCLLELYYLVALKGYPEEENIWEPVSAVKHFGKLISLFHKEYRKKLTATSPPINSTPPMARPIVKRAKPITKQKQGSPAKNASKEAKNWAYTISRKN